MINLISETGLRYKLLYNQGQTKPWIFTRLESGDNSTAHAQENVLWHPPDQIRVLPFTS